MKYVLLYLNGKFVARDDSTGPMSTGGYPYEVPTMWQATTWHDAPSALKYAAMFSGTIDQAAYPVEMSFSDLAVVRPDRPYAGKHRKP